MGYARGRLEHGENAKTPHRIRLFETVGKGLGTSDNEIVRLHIKCTHIICRDSGNRFEDPLLICEPTSLT
jgi:hypothetical protein